MVMFFFPLSFFAFLVCFFGFHYLRHSQLSFFPILGDFMRYLVRILIDSIINDSLVHGYIIPLSFFTFLVCFFEFHYLRCFQLSFFPILGDFMRYLVRILIDSIINDSLAIMTWLYSSFLYLSLHFLFASLDFII
jgi:hypothetical protein